MYRYIYITICVCIYTYIGTYYFGASGHTHIAEHARAILTHPFFSMHPYSFLYASIFIRPQAANRDFLAHQAQ